MSNSEHHQVIIIPGLGDRTAFIEKATLNWRKRGLEPEVVPFCWGDASSSFDDKLSYLLTIVDQRATKGEVSLVGTSAGGSAAVNALLERPDQIMRVVNICGRLKRGLGGLRSLERMSSSNPAFRHSVELLEDRMKSVTPEQRLRMMTVRALLGDEYVPADTIAIPGSNNIVIPTGEHIFSIGAALTVFSKPILDFLQFGWRSE